MHVIHNQVLLNQTDIDTLYVLRSLQRKYDWITLSIRHLISKIRDFIDYSSSLLGASLKRLLDAGLLEENYMTGRDRYIRLNDECLGLLSQGHFSSKRHLKQRAKTGQSLDNSWTVDKTCKKEFNTTDSKEFTTQEIRPLDTIYSNTTLILNDNENEVVSFVQDGVQKECMQNQASDMVAEFIRPLEEPKMTVVTPIENTLEEYQKQHNINLQTLPLILSNLRSRIGDFVPEEALDESNLKRLANSTEQVQALAIEHYRTNTTKIRTTPRRFFNFCITLGQNLAKNGIFKPKVKKSPPQATQTLPTTQSLPTSKKNAIPEENKNLIHKLSQHEGKLLKNHSNFSILKDRIEICYGGAYSNTENIPFDTIDFIEQVNNKIFRYL